MTSLRRTVLLTALTACPLEMVLRALPGSRKETRERWTCGLLPSARWQKVEKASHSLTPLPT